MSVRSAIMLTARRLDIKYPFARRVIEPFVVFARGRKSIRYERWVEIEREFWHQQRSEIVRHIDTMPDHPTFSLVIDAHKSMDLVATIRTIRQQLYPAAHIFVLPPPGDAHLGATNDATPITIESLPGLTGDYVVFVQSGDQLSDRALYEFASTLNATPDTDLIYADEDRIDSRGRRSRPFFKPDWSPDYLETFNYIGYPACFRLSTAKECFGSANYYDFVLRFTERTARISHLPKVLAHRSIRSDRDAIENESSLNAEIGALQGRLTRTGRTGTVMRGKHASGYYDITLQSISKPLVSIIIPTAGKIVSVKGRTTDLVINCVTQIRKRTTYKNFEIVIVHNGDLADVQRATLQELGCKLVAYSEKSFNVSKKLNLGAAHASGELFLLLNDDIEPITPDWIERMREHFEKPHVGVVGAKLLYPDDTLQHVGVVHNSGNPIQVRRLYPRNDPGYFFSTCGTRNFAAVTGACMMTPSSLYRQIGGYTEDLAVNYNDIDYCMKARAAGRYTLNTPRAELYHFESQSRDVLGVSTETLLYQRKWAREIVCDPFYNERFLSVSRPTFEPRVNPR